MAYAPTNPLDIPPYQMQSLVSGINNDANIQVRCAQALGSEIYVGCSNGDLLRFALQADDPSKLEAYTLLSRQPIPTRRPIDEIVLIPSLSRALILSDHQLHFYIIPSLEPIPHSTISPIRHVVTFAVDHEHLQRPPPTSGNLGDQVEFCVIKRTTIMMYALRDRLVYQKEIPLPQGASLARRTGRALCIADKIHYNMVDLEAASLFPILPLSQAPDPTQFTVRPFIIVVAPGEFLILSWTGASTLGLFITGDGDPVRGTLEWPNHPEAVCLDYPYITTLLPNETIEIHNVATQMISQVISAPSRSRTASPISRVSSPSKRVSSPTQRISSPSQHIASPTLSQVPDLRKGLVASLGGYFVPSTQRSARMKTIKVGLLRGQKQGDDDISGQGVVTPGQTIETNPAPGVANLDVTGYEL